jgi:hypothetical protein
VEGVNHRVKLRGSDSWLSLRGAAPDMTDSSRAFGIVADGKSGARALQFTWVPGEAPGDQVVRAMQRGDALAVVRFAKTDPRATRLAIEADFNNCIVEVDNLLATGRGADALIALRRAQVVHKGSTGLATRVKTAEILAREGVGLSQRPNWISASRRDGVYHLISGEHGRVEHEAIGAHADFVDHLARRIAAKPDAIDVHCAGFSDQEFESLVESWRRHRPRGTDAPSTLGTSAPDLVASAPRFLSKDLHASVEIRGSSELYSLSVPGTGVGGPLRLEVLVQGVRAPEVRTTILQRLRSALLRFSQRILGRLHLRAEPREVHRAFEQELRLMLQDGVLQETVDFDMCIRMQDGDVYIGLLDHDHHAPSLVPANRSAA